MERRQTLTAMATAVLPTNRLLFWCSGGGGQPVMPCLSGRAVVVSMELAIQAVVSVEMGRYPDVTSVW
jgi:hypothetical protein